MSDTSAAGPNSSSASYVLGVDLGTTYTAAAIRRGDRSEIVDLGTRNAAIPSVVYLRDDGTVLTGEAAIRRGATDPGRLSREFKRRMGDTTAILLGGVPHSVDALMASMLRSVVATVTERQGTPPSRLAIAHPANWGQYKKDLLDQAVRRADLNHVTFVTEPQAAAVHYSTLERLDPGAAIAVYDLGGGTFDAAVLRKTADGFELLGEPEGIERLGGIDFDEAVFRHVVGSLVGALDQLDPDDPVVQAAVSRLREECVAAKEALSSDTEVSVPVILPSVHTEVRLTRAEFEAMIRPALGDTLIVMRRALRSAGLEPGDLHSVLLVGGSSRIPLISQMVGADLSCPVALDIHPKHSVALGAAVLAAGAQESSRAATSTTPSAPTPTPTPTSDTPVAQPVGPVVEAVPASAPVTAPAASVPSAPTTPMPAQPAAVAATPFEASTRKGATKKSNKGLLIGAGVAILVGVGAVAIIANRGDGDASATPDDTEEATDPTDPAGVSSPSSQAPAAVPTSTTGTAPSAATTEPTTAPTTQATTTTTVSTEPPAPPDPCAEVGDEPCIRVEALRVTPEGAVEVTWTPFNFEPQVNGGLHAHLYWDSASADQASSQSPNPTPWDAVDNPVHTSTETLTLGAKPPEATGVCATVGTPEHAAYNPAVFHCLTLP